MRHSVIVIGIGTLVFPSQTFADTTVYTYDALGRLTVATVDGGPNNGKTTSTSYDDVGNRIAHATGMPLPVIVNNVTFSVSGPPGVVLEGGNAVFTVTKTGPAANSLFVNFTTVNGTASAPSDFTATSGTLTFRHWETTRTISIPIIDDGVTESQENFSIALQSPSSGAAIGTTSALAQIGVSTSGNQAPVPYSDSATVRVCETVQKNVVANDTDPEGNYPLSLTNVTVLSSSMGSAYIANNSDIVFTSNGTVGNATVKYTVKDSLGATATGTLMVNIQSGQGCL